MPTILYGYGGFQISMTPKYVPNPNSNPNPNPDPYPNPGPDQVRGDGRRGMARGRRLLRRGQHTRLKPNPNPNPSPNPNPDPNPNPSPNPSPNPNPNPNQANIRGGGEFGPTWHQAAKKELRNKAYEDFEP